jgi:NAD(P)H dehydrogenase (quinone)
MIQAGLPEPLANFTAGLYAAIAQGETSKAGTDLENLIGTPTPLIVSVKQVLKD